MAIVHRFRSAEARARQGGRAPLGECIPWRPPELFEEDTSRDRRRHDRPEGLERAQSIALTRTQHGIECADELSPLHRENPTALF